MSTILFSIIDTIYLKKLLVGLLISSSFTSIPSAIAGGMPPESTKDIDSNCDAIVSSLDIEGYDLNDKSGSPLGSQKDLINGSWISDGTIIKPSAVAVSRSDHSGIDDVQGIGYYSSSNSAHLEFLSSLGINLDIKKTLNGEAQSESRANAGIEKEILALLLYDLDPAKIINPRTIPSCVYGRLHGDIDYVSKGISLEKREAKYLLIVFEVDKKYLELNLGTDIKITLTKLVSKIIPGEASGNIALNGEYNSASASYNVFASQSVKNAIFQNKNLDESLLSLYANASLDHQSTTNVPYCRIKEDREITLDFFDCPEQEVVYSDGKWKALLPEIEKLHLESEDIITNESQEEPMIFAAKSDKKWWQNLHELWK